jgi:cell wall-associated NlpC family hydrolase
MSTTIKAQTASRNIAVRLLAFLFLFTPAAVAAQLLAAPAALAGPIYQAVDADNDPYSGIYLRNGTSMTNVTRDAAHYILYGTSLDLQCGTWGEAVGPYANRRWHWVRVVNGSIAGAYGWIADRYVNTPNAANQLTPGEAECGSTPAPPPPPPPGTYLNTTTPVRMCTNLGDASCGTIWNLAAGTQVTMRCWIDESSYAGTVRWFWISGAGVAGFVSANQVSAQTSVGWCGNDSQVKAIRWAARYLNENAYVGWCLSFVHDAWINAGRDIGSSPTAVKYWNANPRGYARGYDATPPAGALVFWKNDSYSPDGHVAISIGNGWAISTYERSTQPVHVMSIADRNRTKPYAGYLIP